MPFRDLREFIARLEKEGEAQRIEEEIDWNLEAGAIIRRSNEKGLPAPFFQKIKDHPSGYRLFGEVLATHKRVAIAMDMETDTPVRELVEEYSRRKKKPIKPVLVHDGPCKENIQIGDEVDLLKFPVPMVHSGDGGRYIGTFHLTIAKDAESEWINWGMHRHMLHNRNTLGILAHPATHVMRICQKWQASNKPIEIAIAIGVEPISTLCAASPIPYGVSEVDVVGGIRGEPAELVKCETVDLAVPATAEIVIEGELRLHEKMEEGPFGEFTGYKAGHRELRPTISVRAVTHRNNPILTMGSEGIPTTNSHIIQSVSRAAEFLDLFRAQGLPVTGVSEFAEGVQLLAVVAIKAGLARADDIAHVIWGSRVGHSTPWVIVVEDDVDPFDIRQVIHALVSKCHPYRGIVRLEHARGLELLPWLSRHERKYRLGARVYFDCTWPPDWEPKDIPERVSFAESYPEEVQEKALATWHKYGY